MQMLCYFAITNAILATVLAAFVWMVSRWIRRPALLHLLWVMILVRLLMPPVLIFQTTGIGNWLKEASTAPVVTTAWTIVKDAAAQRQKMLSIIQQSLSNNNLLPRTNLEPIGVKAIVESLDGEIVPVEQSIVLGKSLLDSLKHGCAYVIIHGGRLLLFLIPLWIVGSIVVLAVQIRLALMFSRRLKRETYYSRIWQSRMERVARRMGLLSCPKLLLIRDRVPPMLWGFASRTYVLFPEQLLETLDARSQDTLLAHELGHYRRGDHYVRALELAVLTVFWWHPVVWWARHHIEAAEEECCDAWAVTQSEGNPRTYAEALLSAVDFVSSGPRVLPPAASGIGSNLLRKRLTSIMRPKTRSTSLAADGYIAVFLLAVIALPPCPALWNSFNRPATLTSASSANIHLTASSKEFGNDTSLRVDDLIKSNVITGQLVALGTSKDDIFALTMDQQGRVLLQGNNHQHDQGVGRTATAAFFSMNDQSWIALGRYDGSIDVVNCNSGDTERSLRYGVSAVTSIATSSRSATSEPTIAASFRDGTCRIIDLARNDSDVIPREQPLRVRALRFAANHQRLAILSDHVDGSQVEIWDLETLKRHSFLATSQRLHTIVATRSSHRWLLVGVDGTAAQWQEDSTRLVPEQSVPRNLLPRLAFTPTGMDELQAMLPDVSSESVSFQRPPPKAPN